MAKSLPNLDESILESDPIRQFHVWLKDARDANVPQWDAVGVATATHEGAPSVRMVLLKHADEEGFVFYTNYHSRKGREIAANPRAALVFYWAPLNRSVRVEGTVEKVSVEESDAYFASRPREKQLSSITSQQSTPVGSREELDRRYQELSAIYEGKLIPRPEHWGGLRVKPFSIEFWQQRFARLNDRILYTLNKDGTWNRVRLSP